MDHWQYKLAVEADLGRATAEGGFAKTAKSQLAGQFSSYDIGPDHRGVESGEAHDNETRDTELQSLWRARALRSAPAHGLNRRQWQRQKFRAGGDWTALAECDSFGRKS